MHRVLANKENKTTKIDYSAIQCCYETSTETALLLKTLLKIAGEAENQTTVGQVRSESRWDSIPEIKK